MRVRPATEADLDAIARVRAQAMVASDSYEESLDVESEYQRLRPQVAGYFRGTYDPSFALSDRSLWVAEEGEEVVGIIAGHASTRLGCDGELQWMFVVPGWQRRGVGAALLRPMARWFAAQERTRVIIDAPPENPDRAFYLKHGAVPLDQYWLHWPDIAAALGV